MKTIKIELYPCAFQFKIRTKLPKFRSKGELGKDYECEMCDVRNKLLLKAMKKQKIHSKYHAYEDYVVEVVTETAEGETWILGS